MKYSPILHQLLPNSWEFIKWIKNMSK